MMAIATGPVPAPTTQTADPALSRPLAGRSAAVLAGALLLAAGATILMGIITGEALYSEIYTTHDNEISDLGATRPPDSVSYQPSSTIFNMVMIATGAMLIVAALAQNRAFGSRRVTISTLLLGIGVLGVGIFPGNRDPWHGIFALVAFVSGGVAAMLSAHVQSGPFRVVSLLLGATTLGWLIFAIVASGTPVFDELGDGGVERWVAYPVVLWMVAFGGYLLAPVNKSSVDEP
jgi:hypothetical membrane protein